MRRYLLGLLIILLTLNGFAQRRTLVNLPKFDMEPYHFGFILALNQMQLTWKPVAGYQEIEWDKNTDAPNIEFNATKLHIADIQSQSIPGFAVGIVGNLRLGQYFDLRFIPTLALGDRSILYNLIPDGDTLKMFKIKKTMPSTTIDFPLHIKYRSSRHNNFAAYVIGGGKYSIEMASTKKIESNNNQEPVKIDRHDLAAEAGVGVDFYTPYFKFGIEAKMSYGLLDILVKDQYMYSRALDRLNNKVFQLSLTFE
ncbi:MAG TPA: outer membrane beta-barrel protein [Bacteroidales bacterium]|nr:outer membrane beta-barrel protein [Bacteroidales bacterium]